MKVIKVVSYLCIILFLLGIIIGIPALNLFDASKKQPYTSAPILKSSHEINKPSVESSTDAYHDFAKSKHLSLKDIPEDLLTFLVDDKHGDIIFAIMFVESSFRPNLKYANNYGLMQISDVHFGEYALAYKYLRDCGVKTKTDLFDPYKNVCVGRSLYLFHLEKCDNNQKKALMAYNASPRKCSYALKVSKAHKELQEIKRRK